jgi:tetratricopeptide (TPR) repeat protein
MSRPKTSLTVIARDEAHNLSGCLGSVAGLFDEVVVLDTGSSDRTRDVAAGLGAKVSELPWPDSFAAARNAALERASGAWAFRLDADERLDPGSRESLQALLAALPAEPRGVPEAFAVRCRHEPAGGPVVELDEVRLFPVRPDLRWRYRVHEQVVPAVLAAGGSVRRTGVRLLHAGYADAAVSRAKLARNLRLLELDAADFPDDAYVLFYLGWTRLELGQTAGACEALERACRAAPASLPVRNKCHAALVLALRAARRLGEALGACRAGRAACPRDAELACQEAELLLAGGDRDGAFAIFRDLLAGRFEEDPRPPGGGACGQRPRHGLACCLPPERAAERESLWRQALALRPDFGPAWLALGESLAVGGQTAALRTVTAAAESALPGGQEGAILRARLASVAGDYRLARRELERYCRSHPAAVLPRVALAQTIVLEGRDRAAAARTLAELNSLEPGHPEAARLLAILARWGG